MLGSSALAFVPSPTGVGKLFLEAPPLEMLEGLSLEEDDEAGEVSFWADGDESLL